MLQVHARFKLIEDGRISCWSDGGYVPGARIKMAAIQGPPFGTATPSGSIDMVIANPEAIPMFRDAELGQEFDVIFSPVQ